MQRAPDRANKVETSNPDGGDVGGGGGGSGGDVGSGGGGGGGGDVGGDRRLVDSCAQTGPPSFRMVRFKQATIVPDMIRPRYEEQQC